MTTPWQKGPLMPALAATTDLRKELSAGTIIPAPVHANRDGLVINLRVLKHAHTLRSASSH